MGEYHRITRECTLDNMRPELGYAIRAHIDKNVFEDDFEDTILMCFETISTKEKKRIFRTKTEVVLLGAILTPTWLIWAVGEDGEHIGVLKAKLRDIQVEDYETSSLYDLVQDSGINILNYPTSNGQGLVFIGLGPEPVSQRIKETLREANKKACIS